MFLRRILYPWHGFPRAPGFCPQLRNSGSSLGCSAPLTRHALYPAFGALLALESSYRSQSKEGDGVGPEGCQHRAAGDPPRRSGQVSWATGVSPLRRRGSLWCPHPGQACTPWECGDCFPGKEDSSAFGGSVFPGLSGSLRAVTLTGGAL